MKIDGLPVVDSVKQLNITVQPRDIAKGKLKDPEACAVARACIRQIPGCTAAKVKRGRTILKINKKWVRFSTSPALRTELIAFDRKRAMEPGTFALGAVPKSQKAPAQRRRLKAAKQRKVAGKPAAKRAPRQRIKNVR